MYFLFPPGLSPWWALPRSPGESEGVGGVCEDGCGEEHRGEEAAEEEQEGEETEEVRGEIWEQRYSQLESGGLGGEPDSTLE